MSFNEKQSKLNKELNIIFKDQIDTSFMVEIMYFVLEYCDDVVKNIKNLDNMKNSIAGKSHNLYYIICEHIVGIHESKTINLPAEDRKKLEQEEKYRSEIVDDLRKEIKLRFNIDYFIRNVMPLKGPRFLFYPIVYYLTVLDFRFLELVENSTPFTILYANIANKTLAVLSLLQDNMGDCAYSICRSIIENFIELTIFKNVPNCFDEYCLFKDYELEQSLKSKYPSEFEEKYKNRVSKQGKVSKINYLHYGWVDKIPNYHEVIKINPYSFAGALKFTVQKFMGQKCEPLFHLLSQSHKLCSGYVHGSIMGVGHSITHYIDICNILFYTTVTAYSEICDELNVESAIDEIDIIGEINKHKKYFDEAFSRLKNNFDQK